MNRMISRVAVLGAGVMGCGIAGLIAGAGIPVLLLDVVPRELDDKEKAKGITTESPIFRNRLAQVGFDRLKNPKSGMLYEKKMIDYIEIGNMTDDLPKLAHCDWIIEVVLERLDVKKSVMNQIALHRKVGSIISTNTSGVSVEQISEDMDDEFRNHFLGTHFFNPVRHMRLFEIIPVADTLPEITAFMDNFAETELGKKVVYAKDTTNFIGNRIGAFSTVDAMRLTEKYGYNIPTVDILTGPVMGRPRTGTFKTVDLVGLDILGHVTKNALAHSTDEEEIELYSLPKYVQKLIESESWGDKAKGGFYKKDVVNGARVKLSIDIPTGGYQNQTAEDMPSIKAALKSDNKYRAMAFGEEKESKFIWESLRNVILYTAKLIPEIADDYRMVDRALRYGYNWEKGPFEIWDALGVTDSIARMKSENKEIPQWVEERIAQGKTSFYDTSSENNKYIVLADTRYDTIAKNADASLRDLGDDVLCLELHSKGNSINDNVMDMMNMAVDELKGNRWVGLLIGNQGVNFCAGADLRTIGATAKKGEFEQLKELIAKLQGAMMALKYAPRPVVSAIFGSTLGGGAEIAMQSDCVVAHAETYMGLVEAGVGLLPGGGGCKEMLMRQLECCAEDSKLSMLPAVKKAWKLISMATVSSSAHDAIEKGFLRRDTLILMGRDGLIDAGKRRVLEMAEWGYHAPVKRTIKVLGDYGRGSIGYDLGMMREGKFISEHDSHIAEKVAWVITGGDLPAGTMVPEEYILELEKEYFAQLASEAKTQDRIEYMLSSGKPLRN